MKTLILLVALIMCAGCATTPETAHTQVSEIHTKADRLGTIGGKIIKRAGPVVAATICVAAPEYCIPAKAAYRGAVIAIDAIEAAKTADDGLKLATLAQEFTANIDTINGILRATGQDPIDLTEFQSTTMELAK